ncbi:GntR family transcriptional regulator [Asticcacaulis sp. DW145]|uniref:GntR family transcriptional regulator n=1 Tax=Asticcacaulis sp. DW145 TaxID=3095608 RepID=UPI0030D49783
MELKRQIRESLLDNSYVPGVHLMMADLASRYGVSEGPIRDILGDLAAESLVEHRPNQGYYTLRMDESHYRDIYRVVRVLLETVSANTHSGNYRMLMPAIQALEEENIVAASELLFLAIGDQFGSPWLTQILEHANDKLRAARMIKGELIPNRDAELQVIFDLWASGGGQPFRRAMQKYLHRRERLIPEIVGILNRPRRALPL